MKKYIIIGSIIFVLAFIISVCMGEEWSLSGLIVGSVILTFIISMVSEKIKENAKMDEQCAEKETTKYATINAIGFANNEFSDDILKYENDDMKRIVQTIMSIYSKIKDLDWFSRQLHFSITTYKQKAINVIDASYGSVLPKNFLKDQNYDNYEKITANYSFQVNPIVAAACDATVKKVRGILAIKEDLLSKNNSDKAKYQQIIQKLRQHYKDELALQKIKVINQDVNAHIGDISDITNKEIKNAEFKKILEDITLLDAEVTERRNYEVQYGQIEI